MNLNALDRNNILAILNSDIKELDPLFKYSENIKEQNVTKTTYLRGLIELSNVCHKNCLYCGIRLDNKNVIRYELSDNDVVECATYAYKNHFGSVVLQAGERTSNNFTQRVAKLIHKIKELSNGELNITLSLGEQSKETYKMWRDLGAERYLLRIESSSKKLYEKLHPADSLHSYDARLKALYALKECGYQVGSGIMIGTPFQTNENLADDLLWLKEFDIDMCGMGPFLEHEQTPIYKECKTINSLEWRRDMTFKMIALLRILMPQINIAATTALQSIDDVARERAIKIGANVIMPNITPLDYRKTYKLYENKPISEDKVDSQTISLIKRIEATGDKIGFNTSGTSKHFLSKNY